MGPRGCRWVFRTPGPLIGTMAVGVDGAHRRRSPPRLSTIMPSETLLADPYGDCPGGAPGSRQEGQREPRGPVGDVRALGSLANLGRLPRRLRQAKRWVSDLGAF